MTNSESGLTQQYLDMCRIRAFEEAAIVALKDGHVHGAIHPSIGQEAVAVGVCSQLRRDDILLSTHRGHGHTMMKGADPLAMMRELLGRDQGVCGGKGGSMHIADFKVGMLGANGVVGANIVIATGAAHAIKLRGDDRICVCIFGDGAVNRGPFLEGLNWARIADLPVLFVCEDNAYASTTSTRTVTGGDGPAARARSLGIDAFEVDGNDVSAVDKLAREQIKTVRDGGGPRFIHALTYRLSGHTATDAAAYRSAEELAAGWRRDPIETARVRLEASGISADRLGTLRDEVETEIQAVANQARDTAWPDAETAWHDVQDELMTTDGVARD